MNFGPFPFCIFIASQENELLCLELAASMGLTVNEVCFDIFEEHTLLVVTRFDCA